MKYVHTETGEIIRQIGFDSAAAEMEADKEGVVKKLALKRKVDELLRESVDERDTALGKKVLDFSPAELAQRRMQSRRFDYEKYLREFNLEDQPEGGSHLVRIATHTVCNKLTPEQTKVYRRNPHIQQVFANGRDFARLENFSQKDRKANRELTPRMPYRRRQGEVKTCDTSMDRWTLLSLIEFLNEYGDLASKMVYAGAPLPPDQVQFLSFLFPDHQFVLIGMNQIALDSGKDSENVEVMRVLLTPELASTFQGEDTLLFANPAKGILADQSREMARQLVWVQAMRPKAYSTRFSLPYPPPDRTTTFLDGDIYLPIWGHATGTESRCLGTSLRTREFSHRDYEQYMFYHNTVRRTQYYEHDFRDVPLCHCYDCSSELEILQEYITRSRSMRGDKRLSFSDVEAYVAEMEKDIDKHVKPIAAFARNPENSGLRMGYNGGSGGSGGGVGSGGRGGSRRRLSSR